jgi:hypothetical protein
MNRSRLSPKEEKRVLSGLFFRKSLGPKLLTTGVGGGYDSTAQGSLFGHRGSTRRAAIGGLFVFDQPGCSKSLSHSRQLHTASTRDGGTAEGGRAKRTRNKKEKDGRLEEWPRKANGGRKARCGVAEPSSSRPGETPTLTKPGDACGCYRSKDIIYDSYDLYYY